MTPFEKWAEEAGVYKDNPEARMAWQACAAEAERLCRENAYHGNGVAAAAKCADAIRKLAEVDR